MNDSTIPLWLQVPELSDLVKAFGSAVDVPAFGGRLEVNWAPGARVTSVGGLAYFATFLKTTGLFDRLCADFPVEYASNNASSKRDIVGTAVLAILLGKTRYVHIEAIRHDEAAKELLGLDEIVSDATVRRAFKRGSERDSTSTTPSSPSTAIRKGRNSDTTPSSRDARATTTTRSSSAGRGSRLAWRCFQASSTPDGAA